MNGTTNGSREVICQWLGVPTDPWPPDHYALLGLPAGETDADLIERQAQERMEAVRRYQLTNPEPATEAMNRLAQAFACLSDAGSKRAYDRDVLGTPAPDNAAAEAQAWVDRQLREGFVAGTEARTQLDVGPSEPTSAQVVQWDGVEVPPPPGEAAAPPTATPPVDPLVKAARTSRPARRGLGTKRALYHRITRTRALLHAWEDAGKTLGQPQRRLTRNTQARELLDALRRINRLLEEFPPIMGEAGQPGYLVLALARQQVILSTFQSLLPSQREALARDWQNGLRLLTEHKNFLREESRLLRKKPLSRRLMHAATVYLDEHPVRVLVLAGVLALAIALFRALW